METPFFAFEANGEKYLINLDHVALVRFFESAGHETAEVSIVGASVPAFTGPAVELLKERMNSLMWHHPHQHRPAATSE